MSAAAESNDDEDLEALFDSISAATSAQAPAVPDAAANEPMAEAASERVLQQIGQMTRTLHDSLRELGYDKLLHETAETIPDARERLSYIARMTEQAAGRVLNATDVAGPIQDQLGNGAKKLAADWDRLFANQLDVEQFKALASETRGFLAGVPQQTAATSAQLHEIMMAQDFQDLTGQVIKKITDLAHEMEKKLVAVLLEVAPAREPAEAADTGLLNGPAMNAHMRSDVVASQSQVDELLESLGF
jgi:chemotaxis protein CheZ